MRIDIHTHSFPAHKASEVITSLVRKAATRCPVKPYGNGTLAELIRHEAEDDFDRFAICPIAVRPEQYNYMVRFMTALHSGACGMEAQERVIPCVSLHPDDNDAEAHLQTLIALGAKMVKIHPYFQGCRLDHRKMIKLLRIIADTGLPILCHTGGDISYDGDPMASPRQILNVYRRIPKIKLICAHCAAWHHPEAHKLLLGRSIYVDLSYQKNGGVENIIRDFAERHPQDYVLFGSDWPWGRPAIHAKTIASWNIDKPRLNAIMGGNAKRLLNL